MPIETNDQINKYSNTTFGQLRVAQREVLFQNVQTYSIDTRQWGTETANDGAVSYDSTTGQTIISVTGDSGSMAAMQTHTHFPYEPGATTHMIATLSHSDSGQSNQRRRWGLFDASDGVFFELIGTNKRLVRRTSTNGSPIDQVIAERTEWLDPYNELNVSFGQRYEIDLQWLSYGIIRFWVNGRLLYQVEFANTLTVPYMRTAQLPLRFEIENTDTSSPGSLKYVCSSVYLDGGTPIRYVPGKWSLSSPVTMIGTSFTPVLGLRLASSLSGRDNRKIVLPAIARISNASGRGTVRLVLNPSSITGGTWTPIPETPWMEYNEGIVSITNGIVMSESFLPNTNDARELDGQYAFALNGIHLRREFDNSNGDTIVFVAAAVVANMDIVSLLATFLTLG